VTVEQAINDYICYLKLKTKYNSYRTIKNKIENYILNYFDKNKLINDITKTDILKWQEYIETKNFSFRYKKTLHVCFVMFLNYCIKYYDLKENVASIVGNFKDREFSQKSGNIWSIEEFNRFNYIIDNKIYKVLFTLMFFTGCRLGELLALTFDDIEDNKIKIYKNMTRLKVSENERLIESPKTRSSVRTISIDDTTLNLINELKEEYKKQYDNFNNQFLIFGATKPLSHTTITRYKNKYCKIANVKQIKLHEFRHSHACLLYQNNVPIDDIKNRLGHSKMSITIDIYLKNLPRNEKRVLDTLNFLHTV